MIDDNVTIAYRLQSGFGRIDLTALIREGIVAVTIAYRLQSGFGPKKKKENEVKA